MKIIISSLFILAIFALPASSTAQQINWKNFKDNKTHIANIHLGWDYGAVAGIAYGQKLKTKLPIVLGIDYSSPLGKKIFDDLKTKIGGQAEVFSANNFSATAKAYGIFRRSQNQWVRLLNFGAEFSASIGYYKTKWYVAGEFGFDKAITTHIKSSPDMKTQYPNIQDGWYIPTGGNFSYGIASGYAFQHHDIYLKLGKQATQDFKTTPTAPFYFQIGFNTRF